MKSKTELPQKILEILANFDSMPRSAFVRLRVVSALYGVSIASIWRNSKKGIMPAPKKLSERCTAWNVGEIKDDLAAKAGV